MASAMRGKRKWFNFSCLVTPSRNNIAVYTRISIVKNGKILTGALTYEGIGEEELMGILRVKGFDSLKGIKKAFIEVKIIRLQPSHSNCHVSWETL